MKSTLTNGVGCEGWMSELPDNVLLSKLSIPGTHNSMSYTCYEANIILKIISGLSKLGKDRLAELVSQIVELKKNSELSKLGDVLPEELHPILNCTAACQSKTLTEQLQLGARFFDLRLSQRINSKTRIIRQLITYQENNQIHNCKYKPSGEKLLKRSCRNH